MPWLAQAARPRGSWSEAVTFESWNEAKEWAQKETGHPNPRVRAKLIRGIDKPKHEGAPDDRAIEAGDHTPDLETLGGNEEGRG